MDKRAICAAALETWGAAEQTMMLFEEMGELMQAISKAGRAMPCDEEKSAAELMAHIAEEIADVKIMLTQMEILYGLEDAVEDQEGRKLVRLDSRVKAARRVN